MHAIVAFSCGNKGGALLGVLCVNILYEGFELVLFDFFSVQIIHNRVFMKPLSMKWTLGILILTLLWRWRVFFSPSLLTACVQWFNIHKWDKLIDLCYRCNISLFGLFITHHSNVHSSHQVNGRCNKRITPHFFFFFLSLKRKSSFVRLFVFKKCFSFVSTRKKNAQKTENETLKKTQKFTWVVISRVIHPPTCFFHSMHKIMHIL